MLEQLIRILEKGSDHFTILKFTTGYKCVYGTPHLENDEDPKSDYQKLFRLIKTKPTVELTILDCIERGTDAKNIF
jgi:hypothetical protein